MSDADVEVLAGSPLCVSWRVRSKQTPDGAWHLVLIADWVEGGEPRAKAFAFELLRDAAAFTILCAKTIRGMMVLMGVAKVKLPDGSEFGDQVTAAAAKGMGRA